MRAEAIALLGACLVACGGIATVGSEAKDTNSSSSSDGGATVVDCPEPVIPTCDVDARVVANDGEDGCPVYSCGAAEATDGGTPLIGCASAGGTCVQSVASACVAPKRIGDATVYSCGGTSSQCCLESCPEVEAPPPAFCEAGGGVNISRKATNGCSFPACRYALDDTPDDVRELNVHQGDEIQITRSGEGTGGFQWAVDLGGGLAAPLETVAPASGGVGGGATKVFLWRDLPPGDFTVRLKLWRTFSGEVTKLAEYQFHAK